MGKPRLIILIRHAQSEGNKNRAIHQLVPDHRVKLTDEGWKQAEAAGTRLKTLLRPDDTLQLFTSPYRRTRETTEGILRTLTSPDAEDGSPSPFTREKIVVYEEPRLREQDFGNFQPGADAMEKMWQERADYGHFFYRIPNGESAADAYDRVSGFNESLWRQFGDNDFPSVLVLVTHGLMSRVFLMKWYHWSVEYFEDLRNVNHCEFILMRKNNDSGKYILESQLRTWSELKRQRAEEKERERIADPSRRNTLSAFLKDPSPPQHWEHRRPETAKKEGENGVEKNEAEDHPLADQGPLPTDGAKDTNGTPPTTTTSTTTKSLPHRPLPSHLNAATSGITRRPPSGSATPHERPSDDEVDTSYFSAPAEQQPTRGREILASAMRKRPERKATPEDIERWVGESGMGAGRQADALGDEPTPLSPTSRDADAGGEEASESDAGDGIAIDDVEDKGDKDGDRIQRAVTAPYEHPDEEEEMWHEQRGWEYEESGQEIGRNAVERLVEGFMSDDEKEERRVQGSFY